MKLTKRDLVLLGIIIYFTFVGGTFYSQINLFLRIFNQIVVTLILGVWLLYKLGKKESLPRTPLDLAVVLYLLVNFISAMGGQSPRFSLETLWYSVIHSLAFYLIVDLIRRGWLKKLLWAFYMASAAVCLVGLTEFIAWYIGTPVFANFSLGWWQIGGWQNPIPPYIYRLAITLNGSTPLSAYLALFIPPAIALIITLPRKNENRKALIIWLILAFTVQILTFSRAGILALTISLSLTAVGWRYIFGSKQAVDLALYWQKLKLVHKTTLSLGAVFFLSATFLWLQGSFVNRSESVNFRFTLWGVAADIFQDNLILGAGPANFGRALLRFNQNSLPRSQIATAHNIYLNTAAELGIMGLLVGLFLYLVVGKAWLQRWRQSSNSSDQLRLVACGAALAGFVVQTLVDTYTATPNVLPVVALTGYIVSDLNPKRYSHWRLYPVPAALLILLLYGLGFARLAQADMSAQRSFNREGVGNLSLAITHAAEAQNFDPGLTGHIFRLALLEAQLADQNSDPKLLDAAIEHYQTGLTQEPIWGLNSANLAGLLWQQGAQTEAVDTLQQTISVEANPLYLVNLGYFYEQQGNWNKASMAYGRALLLSPQLAASGFWQATPSRAEKWPDFVEMALQQTDKQQAFRVSLALAQQNFTQVEELVQPANADQFLVSLVELHLSREQPEQAAAVLGSNPQTGEEYLLWGRIKLQLQDYVAAEELLKTAAFMSRQEAWYYLGQLFEQQGELQAAIQAYQRGFTPHATAENIEMTIYGRFGGNDLAPQLIRVGVGPRQAKSWLALAELYEKEQRFTEAKRVYLLLLAEDPYLKIAQERLDLLVKKISP